jgi:hypothetical protein
MWVPLPGLVLSETPVLYQGTIVLRENLVLYQGTTSVVPKMLHD